MLIFRAWITLKDGTRIYARDYDKRAFCFETGNNRNFFQNKVNRSENDSPKNAQSEN
jgi:hypothetical protein